MNLDVDSEVPSVITKPPRKRPQRPKRRGILVKIAVFIACVGGLLALLIPAVQSAREAARRSQCTCNLCGIKLALQNYHDTYNGFPPAYVADASGKPMHSWRVLILPFLEQSLHDQYDFREPWDGPNNIKLLDHMPASFACPSWHDHHNAPTTLTSYVVVTGPGTIFPGATTTKIEDIKDGTSNTLMVVEVANMKIPWTSPQDFDPRTMSFRINDPRRPGISSRHPGGANVVFADGSTRFLFDTITPGNLRALITIAGGEGITADQALDAK
jgi:prepilin-type processing-associated H-X9-DG protein